MFVVVVVVVVVGVVVVVDDVGEDMAVCAYGKTMLFGWRDRPGQVV